MPTAKQVKTISITFDHPQLQHVQFTAAPADWRAIHATLTPARPAPTPMPWEWFATVTIVKQDGQPVRVELFDLNKAPVAFAAGKSLKQRIYYRGGNPVMLKQAVNAAYQRSKPKVTQATSGGGQPIAAPAENP